jgi:hypothetical protein
MFKSVVVYSCDEGFKIVATSDPYNTHRDGRYGTNAKLHDVWEVDSWLNKTGAAEEVVSRMIGYLYSYHKGNAIFNCEFNQVEDALHKSYDYVKHPKNYFENI